MQPVSSKVDFVNVAPDAPSASHMNTGGVVAENLATFAHSRGPKTFDCFSMNILYSIQGKNI